jgi:peroxiredoxin
MRSRPFALVTLASALLAAGAFATPALTSQSQLIGKAPQFSATTADGKTYDLKSITKNGPVYLFFIKKDCPVTAGAMSFYTAIGKAYGAKTPILGIFSGDAKEYKAYDAEHKLPFPTVLDPSLSMIAAYKVQTSPWVVEVKADGNVARTWRGYSQTYLQQINKAAAAGAGMPVAKIDFTDAPTDARYG